MARSIATALVALATLMARPAVARQAVATEETRTIKTYPFSRPDPVPMLAKDARLYPYHAYDGYSVEGRPADWRTVKLENEHVAVWVLPDAGGKVWGAIEKAGGEEFIYRNEVMKFRNIALRGPWTSGGIEFNFGVIGHAPWTATPVDYTIETNTDGGASVVVGAMDIPSRTFWRVRVRLADGESAFDTETLWYNPTPLAQPYYNWMTAATFARQDLELQVPGDEYLQHSGYALPWPVDANGRTLKNYRENTFESHKSYHVVGTYQDFFGGYFHDTQWGFGHWSPYAQMPGQKMWLWSLAGDGEIWDPLLTDTDGQYVEFQAGRLFVQYSPGGPLNPIRQASFDPYRTDRWRERWFPIRTIGGMDEASDLGVMHVGVENGVASVGINAFGTVDGTLVVRSGGREVARRPLRLRPLAAAIERVDGVDPADWSAEVPELGLSWSSRPDSIALDRPFATAAGALASRPETDRLAAEAVELLDARRLTDARRATEGALLLDPWNPQALALLTDIELRRGRPAAALEVARRLLQVNTYDPTANWLAGLAWRASGQTTDAREAFGWAERSTAFRSAANLQLAELDLQAGRFRDALDHADHALSYDTEGIVGHQLRALALRRLGRAAEAAAEQTRLLELDPLHHFALAERWLSTGSNRDRDALKAAIRSELPEQTWLEIAISYHNRGLGPDASRLLSIAPEHPMVLLWSAWLSRDDDPDGASKTLQKALRADPGFVFPFRPESHAVVEWADAVSGAWAPTYWRALLLWSLDRAEEAAALMTELGDTPDYGPFYAARAALRGQIAHAEALPAALSDLQRSVALAPGVPQIRHRLIDELGRLDRWDEARREAEQAVGRMPAEFALVLKWARTLLETDHHDQAASMLDTVRVLPSEGGGNGRQLYEWAHWARALDRIGTGDHDGALRELELSLGWPPTLGQGRPYTPDERVQKALMAILHHRAGDTERAMSEVAELKIWRTFHPDAAPGPDVLVYQAFRTTGAEAEAEKVLSELDQRASEPAAAWAAARIRNNGVATDALLAFHPELGHDLAFRLLSRSIDRIAAH